MQRRIGHPAYPAQRMILRYPFLRRNVTEHATLLLIVSAHVLLDAATPSPVTASATFSAACSDPFAPSEQGKSLPNIFATWFSLRSANCFPGPKRLRTCPGSLIPSSIVPNLLIARSH